MNSRQYLDLEYKNLLGQRRPNITGGYSNNPFVGGCADCPMCGGCGGCEYCGGAVTTQGNRQIFLAAMKKLYPNLNRTQVSYVYNNIPDYVKSSGLSAVEIIKLLSDGELVLTQGFNPTFQKNSQSIELAESPEFKSITTKDPEVAAEIVEEKKEDVAQSVQEVIEAVATGQVEPDVAEKVVEVIKKIETATPDIELINNMNDLEKHKSYIALQYAKCIESAPPGRKREHCKHLTYNYLVRKIKYMEALENYAQSTKEYSSWGLCMDDQKSKGVPIKKRYQTCGIYTNKAKKTIDMMNPEYSHVRRKPVSESAKRRASARMKRVSAKARALKKTHPKMSYKNRIKLARTLV